MEREYQEKKNEIVSVFNPTRHVFKTRYDGKELAPAEPLKFTNYPYHLGNHVKKGLVIFVANLRNIKHTDVAAIEQIEKEISDV